MVGNFEGAASGQVKRPRALVVEDNSVNLILMQQVTEQAGYEVVTATHGGQGLELYRQSLPNKPFDVVITDHNMNDSNGVEQNGFEMARNILQQARAYGMKQKIIVISEQPTPEHTAALRQKYEDIGVYDYISDKPGGIFTALPVALEAAKNNRAEPPAGAPAPPTAG